MAPLTYRQFVSVELKRLRKKHPDLKNTKYMQLAAKAWGQYKKDRGMEDGQATHKSHKSKTSHKSHRSKTSHKSHRSKTSHKSHRSKTSHRAHGSKTSHKSRATHRSKSRLTHQREHSRSRSK